jgi:glucokinase
MDIHSETRIVMTLDAGGTNLRFAAMRGGKPVTETISLPSNGDVLTRCLAYDPLQRVAVGMSRLGTSEAVAIGAYAFALQKLGA